MQRRNLRLTLLNSWTWSCKLVVWIRCPFDTNSMLSSTITPPILLTHPNRHLVWDIPPPPPTQLKHHKAAGETKRASAIKPPAWTVDGTEQEMSDFRRVDGSQSARLFNWPPLHCPHTPYNDLFILEEVWETHSSLIKMPGCSNTPANVHALVDLVLSKQSKAKRYF